MRIIGIAGKKLAGKTTVARLFKLSIAAPTVEIAFADALKDEVCKACSITRDQLELDKKVFRPILQWWGTDFRRNLTSENYWVNRVIERVSNVCNSNVACMIPDVRFKNEFDYIKSMPLGVLIRVMRPGSDLDDRHPSEISLDNENGFDYVIVNDGTVVDLKNQVRAIIKSINNKQTPKHHI